MASEIPAIPNKARAATRTEQRHGSISTDPKEVLRRYLRIAQPSDMDVSYETKGERDMNCKNPAGCISEPAGSGKKSGVWPEKMECGAATVISSGG